MRKPTKKVLALIERYTTGANRLLKQRGIEPNLNKRHTNVNTKFGKAHLVVYSDWVHIQFDEPKRAAVEMHYINPFSGKWNQPAFEYDKSRQTEQYVDDCLLSLSHAFEQAEVRA